MVGSSRALRQRPDDFEIVFVEHGRLECETWYRAGRNTVTRWLKESGKAKLLKRRRQFVKAQRNAGKDTDKATKKPRTCKTDPEVLQLAARHLQRKEAGSWVVYQLDEHWWMVGTMRRSAAEMLDKAKSKGFNVRRAKQQISAFPLNAR